MKYVFGAIIVILIILVAYFGITKSIISSDLADSQRDVTALTIANKQYYLASQASQEREKAANVLLKAAIDKANKLDEQTAKIIKPTPRNADDCNAAKALIVKNVIKGAK